MLRYKEDKYFYTNYGALIANVVVITLLAFFFSYLQLMFDDTKLFQSYKDKMNYLKLDSE